MHMHWKEALLFFGTHGAAFLVGFALRSLRRVDDDPNGEAPTLERKTNSKEDTERRREALRRVLTEDDV